MKSDAKTRMHSESLRETVMPFRTKCFWGAMRLRIALGC